MILPKQPNNSQTKPNFSERRFANSCVPHSRKRLLWGLVGRYREGLGEFSSTLQGLLFVVLPYFGHIVVQRIVRIGCTQKSLDGQQNGSDLKGRTPLVLQDVQTDSSEFVDIGVIDFGQKADFGWGHGIVSGQEQFQLEDTLFVRGLFRSLNGNGKISEIFCVRSRADSGDGFLNQTARFLKKVNGNGQQRTRYRLKATSLKWEAAWRLEYKTICWCCSGESIRSWQKLLFWLTLTIRRGRLMIS